MSFAATALSFRKRAVINFLCTIPFSPNRTGCNPDILDKHYREISPYLSQC